jgi:hypothetical protein
MIMRYRVLAPGETAVKAALAAPAMAPFATPLEGQTAEALALVESLQEAGDESAAGGATGSEEAEPAAAEADEAGESKEEFEEAAGAGAMVAIAPAKLGKLDLLITALGTTVPSFLSQFTNLNLLAARLRSAGDLPSRLSELRSALSAVKAASDKDAADAALAQALTAAQGLYTAAAVATQRQAPAPQDGTSREEADEEPSEESVEESVEESNEES